MFGLPYYSVSSSEVVLSLGWEALGVRRLYNQSVSFLTIGSCLACVHRVMDARGKFGEHERSVRL